MSHKKIMAEYYGWASLDFDYIPMASKEVYSPTCLFHDTLKGGSFHQIFNERIQIFPKSVISRVELAVDVASVTVHLTQTGKQEGAFLGMPPTGKELHLRGCSKYRFEGDKVVEYSNMLDLMDFSKQVGSPLLVSQSACGLKIEDLIEQVRQMGGLTKSEAIYISFW